MLVRHGLSEETARAAADEIAADTDLALRFHAREELGIDPDELPSARVAAGIELPGVRVRRLDPAAADPVRLHRRCGWRWCARRSLPWRAGPASRG